MSKAKSRRKGAYRLQLFRDQNGRCFYCGLRMHDDVTLEHLKSLSEGGGWEYSNLRAAHAKCNVLVGNHPVEVKLALRDIMIAGGSDAFFLAAEKKVHRKPRRLKKIEKEQRRKIMEAAIIARVETATGGGVPARWKYFRGRLEGSSE